MAKVNKYKATDTYNVNMFNDFEGIGYKNHVELKNGNTVALENSVAKPFVDNKMLEQVKGEK